MSNDANAAAAARSHRVGVNLIGGFQLLMALVLVLLLFDLWPERSGSPPVWSKTTRLGVWGNALDDDARLILIVLCTGALGSCVHAATSFASYVGNKRLVLSWGWWYVLRPFIGMALALIFYFVLRGGLLSGGTAGSEMNVYGLAAVAGLVGMFSKQATDKLRELFDNLFRTEKGHGDDARDDKLAGNLPVTSAMIERRKIAAYVVAQGADASGVALTELHRMLGGVVTRIPVLRHDDSVLCVVHQSLLYKFLALHSLEALRQGRSSDVEKLTLADLLADDEMKVLVQDSLAFVPAGAMLSEAKDRMEATPNCQDVFITEHGVPTEAVVGWLTDAEVRRIARV